MRRRSSTKTTSSCSQALWGPIRSSAGCRRETSHRAPTLRSGGGKAPPPPAGRGVARHGRRAHRRWDRQGRRRARARTPRPAVLSERSRSSEPDGGGGHGDQEARAARRLIALPGARSQGRPADGRLGVGPWADADRGEARSVRVSRVRGRSSGRCSFGYARSASKAHMMQSGDMGTPGPTWSCSSSTRTETPM